MKDHQIIVVGSGMTGSSSLIEHRLKVVGVDVIAVNQKQLSTPDPYIITNPRLIEPRTKESYQGHAGPHKYRLKETIKKGNELIQIWECRCGHRL